mgnify:CR=1 FL=1
MAQIPSGLAARACGSGGKGLGPKHCGSSKAAAKRAENKVEREKLLAILAEKQAGKLSELSEKEIQRRINALDA